MRPVRPSRLLPVLLLTLLAVLLCAGPGSASVPPAAPAGVAAAVPDCTHPPTALHAGGLDQVPRRADDDPPGLPPAAGSPVSRVPAGHAGTALPVPPERAILAPSPVEQLCVNRN